MMKCGVQVLTLSLFLLATGSLGIGQNVVVEPVVSTSSTPDDADDPAIWINRFDPVRSVVIGTDKDAGIFVWDMNGTQLQHIAQGTRVNNVDVRYDVELGGEMADIVAANLRGAGKLAVFKVNPDYSGSDVLEQIADRESENNDIQDDSYGFALYRRPTDGALFLFERPQDEGQVRQYQISDDGSGLVVNPVRDLEYDGGTAEGFVADDNLGFVYVTEEGVGIHKFHADPDMSSEEILLFATGDGIEGDREGLALYACDDGSGYLILSSQGNSTFKIYDRQGENSFLKTIDPRDHLGDSGLGTDGLDVTSFSAPPNFPQGFLIAHHQAGSRYHLYDWADVAGDDLTICVDGGGVIPVELVSFDAQVEDNTVTLRWLTATESNNFGFDVERRSGDESFQKIGFVPGQGSVTNLTSYEYIDRDLRSGRYSYRLKQIDTDGAFTYSPVIEVQIGVPVSFSLSQNFPNPFNAGTAIAFSVKQKGHIRIDVYDVQGRHIRTLIDREFEAGRFSVRWDGTDDSDVPVASGLYIYRLDAGGLSDTKRMILLK